ncbi:oligosaccharide flippase family protein [Novosphingobium sp. Gsoil 351]|nr:oligosaccharide flippase family protein [Novosphingobium sp. Gsoil 351]
MTVRGAAMWAMAGQYLSFAIQFAASVIISRFFLGPAEVGLFSIALAAAMLVAVLQDFGLSRYISGLARLDADEIARCSSVGMIFSFAVAGVIALAAWPLAHLYAQPDLAPILWIIASSYLFLPLAVVPLALMGRAMQFRGHFTVNVAGALAQALVGLGLAAAGWSSFALAWATVASGVARGLVAQALRPAPPWPFRLDGLRAVLGFGSRSSALYLTGALGTRSPDLIIGKLLGLAATGIYSRAAALADQFRVLISGAIGSVFFPAFARIRDRGEPLGPAYLRVCAGYSAVIWPGMAGLALAAEPLVRLLYGPAWAGVAPLLTLIAIAEMLIIALPLHIDMPILMGRMDRLLAFNIADTVLSIALLAAGSYWGVLGAAASRVVYAAAWIALYGRFLHEVVRFDVRALLSTYLKSALGTLAALAPMAATYRYWQSPATIDLATLLLCALAGVACWSVTLAVTSHPAFAELLELARQVATPLKPGRRPAVR